MDEPSLEKISDYNTLSAEKRKVVVAVILACLVIGAIYTIAYNVYDKPSDAIEVQESIRTIPVK
jgi:hypothetical protein